MSNAKGWEAGRQDGDSAFKDSQRPANQKQKKHARHNFDGILLNVSNLGPGDTGNCCL